MADENYKTLRIFLNLAPLQFVDVVVPSNANFIYLMNMWRSQGFLVTETDYIEWKHVIGIRLMPVTPEVAEEIKAEKARLN